MTAQLPKLQRQADQPAPPVRILHLGLGNFFRAHQAWYTANASDSSDWGIAAFTGRRPDMARVLAPQDGLYTLVVRTPTADEVSVVDSLSAVHTASDHESWLTYFRDPLISIVTVTVTEAGYFYDGVGLADDPAVAADIAGLSEDPLAPMSTAPGKLVAGLLSRYAADAGPITLLSCDNLPNNGAVVERVIRDFAGEVDSDLAAWLTKNVDFASAMVDRITPAASPEDVDTVARELGVRDASPVRSEPFSEWVISGEFPGGRPDWESAGAQIVDDVHPYEQRKLLLLNGAHSLLAYAGSAIGHETVDEAIADPRVHEWVQELWDDAASVVPLPAAHVMTYRAALIERFTNPRMSDALARIAMDGSQKIPVRIVPVIESARKAGRMPRGAARALAAWIAHLRGVGAPFNDSRGESWRGTAEGDLQGAVSAVLDRLALGDDHDLVEEVMAEYSQFDPR